MIFELLFFALLFYFGWQILKVVLRIRRLQRDSRAAFEQMFGGMPNAASGARKPEAPQKPRKRYGPKDGEYVKFEEINITQSTTTVTDDKGQKTQYTETQIEDVEWEEL